MKFHNDMGKSFIIPPVYSIGVVLMRSLQYLQEYAILKILLKKLNSLYENIEQKFIFIKEELTKEKYNNKYSINEMNY